MFGRIVVGVDGSAAGREALRQALALLVPGGRIVAVSAYDPSGAARAGWDASELLARARREAESALTDAVRALAGTPGAASTLAAGHPVDVLLATAERERAELVAVGARGLGRAAGIVLGSVATTLVHRAPHSVLVARGEAGSFAGGIVVGIDGSEQAAVAERVARRLAEHLGVPLRTVVASGGKPVALERLRAVPDLQWEDESPVAMLVRASRTHGLVVVGSRGLHGVSALGSVSERVAHRAHCSVLVVREPVAVTNAAAEELSATGG